MKIVDLQSLCRDWSSRWRQRGRNTKGSGWRRSWRRIVTNDSEGQKSTRMAHLSSHGLRMLPSCYKVSRHFIRMQGCQSDQGIRLHRWFDGATSSERFLWISCLNVTGDPKSPKSTRKDLDNFVQIRSDRVPWISCDDVNLRSEITKMHQNVYLDNLVQIHC